MKKKIILFMSTLIAAFLLMLSFSVDTYAAVSYCGAGASDTAYYKKVDGTVENVTLDELQDYYLDHKGNTTYNKNGIQYPINKYKTVYSYNDYVYVRGDDPIISFVPKTYFATPGDHIVFGEEYGFYVHTEEWGVTEAYISYVYLIDIENTFGMTNNTLNYTFEAKLIANNVFATIKKDQIRNRSLSLSFQPASTRIFKNEYELDSSVTYSNLPSYITVPFVNDIGSLCFLDSFGPLVMENIKMFKPVLSVTAGNQARITRVTSPYDMQKYAPIYKSDNTRGLINAGLTGVSFAAGALPQPYGFAVKTLATLGQVVVNGQSLQPDIQEAATHVEKGLDDVIYTPNYYTLENVDGKKIWHLNSTPVEYHDGNELKVKDSSWWIGTDDYWYHNGIQTNERANADDIKHAFVLDFDSATRLQNAHIKDLNDKMLVFEDVNREEDHSLIKVIVDTDKTDNIGINFKSDFLFITLHESFLSINKWIVIDRNEMNKQYSVTKKITYTKTTDSNNNVKFLIDSITPNSKGKVVKLSVIVNKSSC